MTEFKRYRKKRLSFSRSSFVEASGRTIQSAVVRASIWCVSVSYTHLILSIAVPNGIESGIFQLVKVALSSVVALFGTYQIAANGIAQSIWSMAALTSSALSTVFILSLIHI